MEQLIQKQIDLRDGGFVTVDVFGTNPSAADEPGLAVLPGVMSNAHAWRGFAGAVEAWPTVAVINRRGRHPSSPLPPDYSIETEINDLEDVLENLGTRSVFAWSYGGLIALHAGNRIALDRLIAYEPIQRPFAAEAIPSLRAAHEAEDWDRAVEIINMDISGFDADHVARLRSNRKAWTALRELARPLYPETAAINSTPPPPEYGSRISDLDFILGGDNLGEGPYGTTFEDVTTLTPRARTHVLSGQGHMAHLQDPLGLARLVDDIAQGSSTGM